MAVDITNRPLRRPKPPRTPELDRQRAVITTGANTVVGGFLDHLQEAGIVLARWHEDRDLLYQISESNEHLMADFFDLDLDKIEWERRALLTYMRRVHDYNDRKKADE
jgi:hypothetical protein